jgi:ribosomal-protein-alanine N-acetyltransferase
MDDLSDLVTFANNPKIARNLTDAFPHPYTEEDGRAFMERFSQIHNHKVYAISFKDRAIGGVGIHPKNDVYRYSAEIGYWLAEPYWRRGIMSSALLQLIKIAFTETAIVRLEAGIYDHNTGSIGLLEKLRFTKEGIKKKGAFKQGEFMDLHLFRLLKDEARDLGYI